MSFGFGIIEVMCWTLFVFFFYNVTDTDKLFSEKRLVVLTYSRKVFPKNTSNRTITYVLCKQIFQKEMKYFKEFIV